MLGTEGQVIIVLDARVSMRGMVYVHVVDVWGS